MTLTEVMIATAILSVVFVAFMGAFGSVAKGIQSSRAKTLATNLAQEQMQVLKQKSYYKVLVTTSTAYLTEYNPAVPYDTGYNPPETINEGGMTFRRYTYVQAAREVSGNLQYLGAVPDTGMKSILVTVSWTFMGEPRKLELRSVIANPDTVMAISTLKGNVRQQGTGTAIPNAMVTVAENVGWADEADNSGAYSISLLSGNHLMVATKRGYFPAYQTVPVGANQTVTQDFDLVIMDSGTVRGSVWMNDHLVISGVVGSTQNAMGFNEEYVEVFNPTTWTWTMSSGGIGMVGLQFQRPVDASKIPIQILYNTTSLEPGKYYLFANTGTLTAWGTTIAADAVWDPAFGGLNDTMFPYFSAPGDPNIIPTSNMGGEGGGALELIHWLGSRVLDRVGWDRNSGSQSAPFYEGEAIDQNIGLEQGEQFYRYSSTSGYSATYGAAYDSGSNDVDWGFANPGLRPPYTTADAAQPVVAGVPVGGAVVTCTDGLSSPVAASLTGSRPYARFDLPAVATGTWVVMVASGSKTLSLMNVEVTANASVWVPNAATDPVWPAANRHAVILSSETSLGYVSGWVKDSAGLPITVPSQITVSNGGTSVSANGTSGAYFLAVASGTYDITANAGNANSHYASASSQAVVVGLGQVTSDVNFTLTQAGKISGKITRDGINPIPGVAVVAIDAFGSAAAQEVSGSNGTFSLLNLATGSYSIEPVLGSGEKSSPVSVSTTVTAGATVNIGTFTISGAFGAISGRVTLSGEPIRTGVLVIASTAAITSPPALSSATLTSASYYLGNTNEDGAYTLEVRGSTTTTYNLAAYYYTITNSGQTIQVSTRTLAGVTVTAGATTGNQNFTW